MKAAVRAAWIDFTKPMEGGVSWMYLDIKGLVTIAYGNLVDPASHAMRLPLVRPDGSQATQQEIAAAWLAVKGQPQLAQQGYRAAARWTTLRLTDEGMANVALSKFDDFGKELLRRFPDIEEWPADAQLATMSMAWACGPWFAFPSLVIALHDQDFARAATLCHINEAGNPGLIPRNIVNKRLYMNAERARGWHLDPDELQWPAVLEDAVPTQPELPPSEDDGPVMVPPEFPPRDIDTEEK